MLRRGEHRVAELHEAGRGVVGVATADAGRVEAGGRFAALDVVEVEIPDTDLGRRRVVELPVAAALYGEQVGIVALVLDLVGGAEIEGRVEHREGAARNEAADRLAELVVVLRGNAVKREIVVEQQVRGPERVGRPPGQDGQAVEWAHPDVSLVKPERVFGKVPGGAERLVQRHRGVVVAGSDADVGIDPVGDLGGDVQPCAQPDAGAVLGRVQDRRLRPVVLLTSKPLAEVLIALKSGERVEVVLAEQIGLAAQPDVAGNRDPLHPVRHGVRGAQRRPAPPA